MERAKHVKILPGGIERLAREVCKGLQDKTITPSNFSQHQYHPCSMDARAPNWLFVLDTLNFCFWTPTDATKWQVRGQTGYFAMCAAISRALDEDVDITNPHFFRRITNKQLDHILRGDDGKTHCPLISARVKALNEVGEILADRYAGDFANLVRRADRSAVRLLRLIVDEFECFRDEATYEGQQIGIYKRAQIAIGDLWACYEGRGLGEFLDIDAITMFADYRVPQVLCHFGTMQYSEHLLNMLEDERLLANGSAEEVEIRAGSIHAVELVRSRVRELLASDYPDIAVERINSILLDHFLWDYRRKFEGKVKFVPFHQTISIYY